MKSKIKKMCHRKRGRPKKENNIKTGNIVQNESNCSQQEFFTSIILSDEDSTDQEKAKAYLSFLQIPEKIKSEKSITKQDSKNKVKGCSKTVIKSREKSNQLTNSEERYNNDTKIFSFNNSFCYGDPYNFSKSKLENSDKNEFYQYKIGEIIKKKYEIKEFIADGTFGRVLKCINIENEEVCAIKINVPHAVESGIMEAEILYNIKKKDTDNISHCIKIFDSFHLKKNDKNYFAIVYEYLGLSIFDFMKKNHYIGYSMSQIQRIAKQVFEALKFLHSLNYIHTDIKPENIVFINSDYKNIDEKSSFPINLKTKIENEEKKNNNLPFKYHNIIDTTLKVIDFGATLELRELQNSTGLINTRQYRAPEVIFDVSNTDEKTDIWGAACVLYELYTGEYLFDCDNDDEEHLSLIEKVCGHYPDKLIKNARNENILNIFFECKIHDRDYKINIKKCKKYNNIKNKLMAQLKIDDAIYYKHKVFIDFLKYLLVIDPYYRPSAAKALNHEFFKTNFNDY